MTDSGYDVRLGQVWRDRRGGPRFVILDGVEGYVIVANTRGAKRERRIRLDRLTQEYVLVKDVSS